MTGKDLNSTMLLDSCQLLILHEHAIDTTAFPSPTQVCIEQGLTSINLKARMDFQIMPENFRAIIRDVNYCLINSDRADLHEDLGHSKYLRE
jgi:hypothetical protein